MTSALRVACVVLVVAVSTLGEGGASAPCLLAQHLLLATAAVACVLAWAPAPFVPSRGPAAAWLAFAVLAATGAVVAPYAYAAWLVLVEIAAFGVTAWLASGEPGALSRVLPPVVAVLAGAHGINTVAQRFSGAERPASTFLNPNHLGAWLAAAVLLLAGRLLDRNDPRSSRLAYGAAVVSALAGIFVSGSRGAVMGLAAGAVALVGMNWGVLSPRTRRALLAGVAVAMLVMAVGLVERFRGDDDPYRFHRTRIWAASFGAAMNAPWRGTGPGQFAVAAVNLNFPLENAPLRYERSFHTPHSDALRAICEFGIPAGLAAFVAAVLFGIAVVGRRATLSAAGRGAFAALVCLAAQASVDDLSTRPALTLFGASLAGWLIAVPRRRPASRPAVLAAAFLIVAGLGVGEIAGFVAWRSVHELPRGALDASQLAALHRALDWNPMQPDSWERLAEHAEGAGRTWTADDYAAAREAAEHAMRLQPVDAFYTRGAARLAATACLSLFPFAAERDRAAQLYEQAQRLARTDATISLEEAKFLLQAGDPARARRAAEQALKIEPRSGAARLWLARAIWSEQGAAAAVQVRRLLDEAERLAPRLGEIPTSAYDAALRAVDPTSVASLRAELDGTGAASPR